MLLAESVAFHNILLWLRPATISAGVVIPAFNLLQAKRFHPVIELAK